MSGPRRLFANFVALAAATFGLSGFMTSVDAQTERTARVSVIGDSVLLAARDALLAEFTGWDIAVDADESLSLLGALGRLRELAATSEVVVLDLGYNDSTHPVEWRTRVERALDALAGVPHVIWLDQRAFQPGRETMNEILVETATRHPNVDVAPWNAEVVAHPEYVGPDGIHLVGAGPPAMAALIRTRIRAAITPTTTTTTRTPTTTAALTSGARRGGSGSAPTGDRRRDDDGSVGLCMGAAAFAVAGATTIRYVRRRRAQQRQFRARQ